MRSQPGKFLDCRNTLHALMEFLQEPSDNSAVSVTDGLVCTYATD